MIHRLDKSIDLYICYSWYNGSYAGDNGHGICGHTFEMIEYFWKVKDFINSRLLWTERLTWEDIQIAIEAKYNFTPDEILEIKNNSIFIEKPKLLQGSNILIVDGGFKRLRNTSLIFDNIISFTCGERESYKITDEKISILQDESESTAKSGTRQVYESGPRTTHYVKKLLLDRYKEISTLCIPNTTLLYLTTNCRDMSIEKTRSLIKKYNDIYGVSDLVNGLGERSWLIATNDVDKFKILESEFRVSVQSLPIKDFHQQFNNYIYTELERQWDCSNRLIVECKHYKKNFQFDYNSSGDYLDNDRALLSRKFDLLNMDEKLNLTNDKEIVPLLKGILCL